MKTAIFGAFSVGLGGNRTPWGIPGRRIGPGLVHSVAAVDKKAFLLREGCSRWVVRGSGGGSGRRGTPQNR